MVTSWLPNPARRALLQPHNISIPGGGNRSWCNGRKWRSRSGIEPAFDFCVAVHERESARAVVIAAGQIPIELNRVRLVREPGHIDIKIAPVNHVLALIPEYHGAARARLEDIVQFEIQPPDRARHARVTGVERPSKSSQPDHHRHASNTRDSLSLKRSRRRYDRGAVRGTFPNTS